MSADDTIVALSSGGLPAAIAVVRASGPRAHDLIRRVAAPFPAPRAAAYRVLRDGPEGAVIDRGIVIGFEGPASATGEDVAEFHVHGSKAVVSALLRALTALDGVRLAEPGEFTRRAFLRGRMDLTEAEGLADLIAAETEAERRQAVHQAGGALRRQAESWRTRLIGARAAIEAELDFSDEEDVDEAAVVGAFAAIDALAADMEATLEATRSGPRPADGFQVAIVGPPNVGKSSLLNALAEREVAIVTEHAGTTRDVIEARLDLGGFPVVLSDTAGLREARDPVERIGVARARERAASADLVLALAPLADRDGPHAGIEEVWRPATPVLEILTKADLVPCPRPPVSPDALVVSTVTGEGMRALTARLTAAAAAAMAHSASSLLTRERHVTEVGAAVRALRAASRSDPLEIVAEHLREASTALGRVVGAIDVEHILDALFGAFCIGK